MRSGQSHTVWFPELKTILKDRWTSNLTIEEQFDLLAELNCKLSQIRTDNNIQPAMMWCPNCKARHRSRFSDISITALHYAAKRFDLCSAIEFNELGKKWKKFSVEKNLNIYGKSIDETIQEKEIHE